MGQTQSCYVCGAWDDLVVSRISVRASDRYPPRVVGQCPRCRRFICSDHGEKLDLAPRKFWKLFASGKETVLTVCCPFDPGVPLGDDSV